MTLSFFPSFSRPTTPDLLSSEIFQRGMCHISRCFWWTEKFTWVSLVNQSPGFPVSFSWSNQVLGSLTFPLQICECWESWGGGPGCCNAPWSNGNKTHSCVILCATDWFVVVVNDAELPFSRYKRWLESLLMEKYEPEVGVGAGGVDRESEKYMRKHASNQTRGEREAGGRRGGIGRGHEWEKWDWTSESWSSIYSQWSNAVFIPSQSFCSRCTHERWRNKGFGNSDKDSRWLFLRIYSLWAWFRGWQWMTSSTRSKVKRKISK